MEPWLKGPDGGVGGSRGKSMLFDVYEVKEYKVRVLSVPDDAYGNA
jgi:hypothetical protein